MAGPWRSLSLSSGSAPQILIKASLDSSSGYTIHVTDLSRIWSEKLPRKAIIGRAINDECSIDPTEGNDQLNILLEKIDEALHQRDNTSLELQPAERDGLTLTLSAPLPAPFPEFKWNINLGLEPIERVEVELVTPLLHSARHQQALVQALVQEIREKDRVISKVTDRLEQSGGDLTTVFPGVTNVKTSRKKSSDTQREQLAKHVRGLGDFDEAGWTRHHEAVDEHGSLSDEALDEVLQSLLPPSASDEVHKKGWWREIHSGAVGPAKAKDSAKGSQTSFPIRQTPLHESQSSQPATVDDNTTMMDADEDNDAEFQKQGTPPHLKASSPIPSQQAQDTQRIESSCVQERAVADDESTEDEEDDLDAPPRDNHQSSQQDKIASSAPAPKKFGSIRGRMKATSPSPALTPTEEEPPPQRRKLGTIGGKSKASATPDTEPKEPTPTKTKGKLGTIGGRKNAPAPFLSDSDKSDAAPEPSSPPKAKGKLGTIGGKKKAPVPSHSSDKSDASPEPPTPVRTKLGKIGGKKPTASAAPSPAPGEPEQSRRSRPTERSKEPTPFRESSKERADRKRMELKREMEEKAKAPVKKKRKF